MRAREIIRLVHLYFGLSLGFVLVLTGLTGSLLVFYVSIDEALNPELLRVEPTARPSSYESVYRTLRAAHPERPQRWRIEIPESGGAIPARSLSAADAAGLEFAPLVSWVDPGGLAVIRSARWGSSDYIMTWIYDLHYRLLLGTTGAFVMGIIGLGALVLLIAGVVLWWPGFRRVKRYLWFGRNAPPQGRLYELHNVTGIYAFVFLGTVVATGVMISLPDYVRPILSQFSDLRTPPELQSSPLGGGERIPIDTALRIAETEFPSAQLKWIETHDGQAGVYLFRFYQEGEPSRRFPQTEVWIDQYSGEVLFRRDPRLEGAGDTVLNWLHGLHVGEAFGMPGRLVVLLLGFVPVVMFISGALYWLRKSNPRATFPGNRGGGRSGKLRRPH